MTLRCTYLTITDASDQLCGMHAEYFVRGAYYCQKHAIDALNNKTNSFHCGAPQPGTPLTYGRQL